MNLPSTRGPKIRAIPGTSSIFWTSSTKNILASLVNLYSFVADVYMDYIAEIICLICQYFIQQQHDQNFLHLCKHYWFSTSYDIYSSAQEKFNIIACRTSRLLSPLLGTSPFAQSPITLELCHPPPPELPGWAPVAPTAAYTGRSLTSPS